ncbi:MAG TPA: alpha/beta fold hydrolase [Puia sp.]|nr:alpha/beta fold hydrolase [Puia sp.]
MEGQSYQCRLSVSRPLLESYAGINQVSSWWAKDLEGSPESVGGSFTTHFGETWCRFEVTGLVPGKAITWHAVDCHMDLLKDKKEWKDTEIIWELEGDGDRTEIRMTHAGLRPGLECFHDCTNGWNFFLKESLVNFLEGKKGLPGNGIRATIELGGRVLGGTLFSKNQALPAGGENDGWLIVDVKSTIVEHVVSAHSIRPLTADVDVADLKGNYYMLLRTRQSGYAPVNGLQLYYEIEGVGDPLVHIGMGFSVAGITRLSGLTGSRQVISLDLQGRGRTADIDRPLTFEQQAADVIGLLDHLGIEKADLFGECVGGIVAMLIAIRHPGRVRRVATYGSALGRLEEAIKPEIAAGATTLTPDSPVLEFQRKHYEKVAPDPSHWPALFDKFNATRWSGLSPEDFASVGAPVLIAVGDQDWIRLDQAVGYFGQMRHAELAVIPDAGHFVLDAEPQKLLPVLEQFLDRGETKLPFATSTVAYRRGFSR